MNLSSVGKSNQWFLSVWDANLAKNNSKQLWMNLKRSKAESLTSANSNNQRFGWFSDFCATFTEYYLLDCIDVNQFRDPGGLLPGLLHSLVSSFEKMQSFMGFFITSSHLITKLRHIHFYINPLPKVFLETHNSVIFYILCIENT